MGTNWSGIWSWKAWKGIPAHKPILLVIAALIFTTIVLLPVPGSLLDMTEEANPQGYILGHGCETIVETVNQKLNPEAFKAWQESGAAEMPEGLLSPKEVAQKAKVMIAILFVIAFLWGTEALPLGATDALVAILMYVFAIMAPDDIAQAYMKDAVLFIGGVLAVAVGVGKTGLDRRIGLLLLSRIKSAKSFAFIFFPMMALIAGVLSEHALVAILVPVLMGVYKASCIAHGVERDRVLAIFLFLGLCFACNVGGPGTPAAGGRNAIMVGYLSGMGAPIDFAEWVVRGLPLVPVLALTVAAYMYILCKPRFTVKDVNPSAVVKQEVAKLPKFGGKEAAMAVILVTLVILWVTMSDVLGLGGPTLIAVALMFLCRIVTWDDMQKGVAFDVVGLYAGACLMGVGLGLTGGALWLAREFVGMLPSFMQAGNGLVAGASVLTATLTNFMSDGATVGALGPVVLPMAGLGNVSIWKVGLGCAFASSFAHVLIVGTPNNAIAFGMAKDPETGERVLDVFDFIKYGLPLAILCLLVLWGWCVFGYWSFLSWP